MFPLQEQVSYNGSIVVIGLLFFVALGLTSMSIALKSTGKRAKLAVIGAILGLFAAVGYTLFAADRVGEETRAAYAELKLSYVTTIEEQTGLRFETEAMSKLNLVNSWQELEADEGYLTEGPVLLKVNEDNRTREGLFIASVENNRVTIYEFPAAGEPQQLAQKR